jgi:hypothetical protein
MVACAWNSFKEGPGRRIKTVILQDCSFGWDNNLPDESAQPWGQ